MPAAMLAPDLARAHDVLCGCRAMMLAKQDRQEFEASAKDALSQVRAVGSSRAHAAPSAAHWQPGRYGRPTI